MFRQVAQGLVQTAQHLVAHVDQALERTAIEMGIQRLGRADRLAGLGVDVLDADIAIAATQSMLKASEKDPSAQDMWIPTIVDASKGKMRTQSGRLDRTDGNDNSGFVSDPYDAA